MSQTVGGASYARRVTDKKPIDYTSAGGKLGWYRDLVDPNDNQNHGEKHVNRLHPP